MSKISVSVFALFGLLCTSTATAQHQQLEQALATVQGSAAKLAQYHRQLERAVSPDFPRRGVLCFMGCDTLGTATTLKYKFFGDARNTDAFVKTWRELQGNRLDLDLTLKFEADGAIPDCSTKPLPCVSASYCATGCDKVKGPPCTPCN